MSILQTLIDALSFGSTYVLLGLGLTLVFSVLGLINFAYGAVVMWGGFLIAILGGTGLPYPVIIALMLLGLVALSLGMGKFAFQPFRGAPPSTLLLTSFGVALVLQAIAFMLFGQESHTVPAPEWLGSTVAIGVLQVGALQLVTIAASAVVLLALWLVLYRTSSGLQIRAVAENGEVADLMGIRSNRVLMSVFAMSGAIAGVVAFLWYAKIGSVSSVGDLNITLKAFIVVVIGGLGNLRGAVVGGLLLGLFEAILFTYTPSALSSWQQTFAFILVTLVLLVRPQGLVGKRGEVSR